MFYSCIPPYLPIKSHIQKTLTLIYKRLIFFISKADFSNPALGIYGWCTGAKKKKNLALINLAKMIWVSGVSLPIVGINKSMAVYRV